MATTGELRAIIEQLELVDIGDAASYLGEEAIVADEFSDYNYTVQADTTAHSSTCDCTVCRILDF